MRDVAGTIIILFALALAAAALIGLVKPYKPLARRPFFGLALLAAFLLFLLGGAILPRTPPNAGMINASQKPASDEKAKVQNFAFAKMSAQNHVDAARKLLVIGASQNDIDLANEHLDIASNTYPLEVAEMRSNLQKAQVKANQEASQAAQKNAEMSRVSFAQGLEGDMLGQGYDMKITAIGPQHETLRVQWVLLNRPAIYQLFGNGKVAQSLIDEGFTRLLATDGFGKSWSVDPKAMSFFAKD